MTSLSDAFHRARSLLGPTASTSASTSASTTGLGVTSHSKQRREVFITSAQTAPIPRDVAGRTSSSGGGPSSPKRCRSAFDVNSLNRTTNTLNRSMDTHVRPTGTHNRSVDTHNRPVDTTPNRPTEADSRRQDREDDLERRWRESVSAWDRRASTGSVGDSGSGKTRSTTPVRDSRLLTPVGTATSNWTSRDQQQQQQQQAESYPNYVAEVVEQPVATVPKFRSVGECQTKKQFMSLPGASPSLGPGSGALQRRSYPTIRVRCVPDASSASSASESTAIPEAVVVVSCVTAEAPFRAHPNRVYSRDGKSEKGVASASFKRTDGLCELRGLAIERVANVAEAATSLREREVARVDPFKQGFDHQDSTTFDLFAVRLCFQVFLKSQSDDVLKPLKPIVSGVIRDRSGISASRGKSPAANGRPASTASADRLSGQNLDSSKILRVFREKNVDDNPSVLNVSIKREVEHDDGDEASTSAPTPSTTAALRMVRRPTVWIGRNFANSDILRNRTRSRSVGPNAQLACSTAVASQNTTSSNINTSRPNMARSKSMGPDEARRPLGRPRGRPRLNSECAKRRRGPRRPSPSLMEVSDSAWPLAGGKSVILVCDNAEADDIEVRVREKQYSRTGPSPWETTVARDEFHISERGSTVGRIVVTTPQYRSGADTTRKVEASLFLVRPSDGRRSEAFTVSFTRPEAAMASATATATQNNLRLLELSEQTFPMSGGKKIIALCDNAQWRDIEVHLEEKDSQTGKLLWSTTMPLEEFRDSDRGSSAGCIVFSSPEYRNGHLGQQRGFRKTETKLFLMRPSDGHRTEALPIVFTQRQRHQSAPAEHEEDSGHPSEQEDRSPPPRSQQEDNISMNVTDLQSTASRSYLTADASQSQSLPVVSQTFSLAGVSATSSAPEEPLPAPLPLPASSVSSEVRLTAMRNSLSTLTRALGVEREASKFFSQRARDLQRSLDDAVAQRGARDAELASMAAEKQALQLEKERLLRSLKDAEDAKRKEADLRRKEQEARLKEDEARRKEESRRKKKEREEAEAESKRRKRKRRHRSGSESPMPSTSASGSECCCCRRSNSGIAELSSFLRNEFVTQVSTERAEVTRLQAENRRLTTSTQELSSSLKEQRRLADNLAWQMEQKQTMIAALEARLKTSGLAAGAGTSSKAKAVASDRESDSEAAEAQVDSDEEILKSKYDRKKKRRLYHQKRCS